MASKSNLLARYAPHLPYARRYGAALTGSLQSGDAYLRHALEHLTSDPELSESALSPRLALYRSMHLVREKAREASAAEGWLPQAIFQHLIELPIETREIFLMLSVEGFSPDEISEIFGVGQQHKVESLIVSADLDIQSALATRVLIIEDEPVTADDLKHITEDIGHQVVAVASTTASAIDAFHRHMPGLILADIQLADDSSGIDAVKQILERRVVPVIFITAFPERLLTADRLQPTFLITKPYQPGTLQAAIFQALFTFDGDLSDIRPEPTFVADEQARSEASFARNMTGGDVLEPNTSLISIDIRDERLSIIESSPVSRLSNPDLEALRRHASYVAERVAARPEGHNHPGLSDRLRDLILTIDRPFTQATVLVFISEARALELVRARIDAMITDDFAADLLGLTDELQRLCNWFDDWQSELINTPPMRNVTDTARRALITLSKALENQSDEAIQPALRSTLSREREALEASKDDLTANVLGLTLSEALKAAPRWMRARLKGIGIEINSQVEKKGAVVILTVMLGTPVVGALTFLGHQYPNIFGFVSELLRISEHIASLVKD